MQLKHKAAQTDNKGAINTVSYNVRDIHDQCGSFLLCHGIGGNLTKATLQFEECLAPSGI